MNVNLISFITMNTAMLTSKFTLMKTIMRLKLNCGLITLEFAALIKPLTTGGRCSVQEHILKQQGGKFHGFLTSLGYLKEDIETGNFITAFSKK